MYPPTHPPTLQVGGPTLEMYPPTLQVEHNNTFNNTFKYSSPIEAPNKFEIFNNPYWEMQKQINFPDLTDSEIEIGLGTYYLDYPNSKATQVFAFLKEANQKKVQNKPEPDLGRNNPIERFKGRFALKKAYVWTEDFSNKDDFKCYLADLEDLGIEIVGMDFEHEKLKKSLPIPKPTFGKVPSLAFDQRMEEARMARNREILKRQLQNA